MQQGDLSIRMGIQVCQPPPCGPHGQVNTSITEKPSKQSEKLSLFNPLWWKAIILGLRIFSASKEKISFEGQGGKKNQSSRLHFPLGELWRDKPSPSVLSGSIREGAEPSRSTALLLLHPLAPAHQERGFCRLAQHIRK